ncbi:MAG TPA: response regulator transcription factor, partial [Hyphomicrobium sp.]
MKILIVDDHGVVREGLRKLFVAHFEAEVLETAGIEKALDVYAKERPDVVVLDLNLEGAGGLEVLRRVLAADSSARVIVFSMHHEPIYAVRAIRGGARGYVSKSAPVEELIAAIRKVRAGEQYIDRDLASRIAVSQISSDDPLQSLSIREVEILRMLGQGKSMTAIS